MDEFIVLLAVLLCAGGAALALALCYQLAWKPRRQRQLERNHARSKLRPPER